MLTVDGRVELLLEALQSGDSEATWTTFLTAYSQLIYGVIRKFTRDTDHLGDCFLFVCTKLSEKHYRRLRAFQPNGRARFSTWLRAVVRNLCLDWHRSKFGRRQLFRFVKSRSVLDQEIFQAVFQRGLSAREVWVDLSRKGFGLRFSDVEERVEELRGLMSSRQLWLLTAGRVSIESLDSSEENSVAREVSDPNPDPEMIFILRETRRALENALARIDASDRLLLRLRYIEGLGLLEVAKLVGLRNAQTADRRIRDAIERLRKNLRGEKLLYGKQNSASV